MKIAKTGLTILMCMFFTMGYFPAVAEDNDGDFASLQASSTVPVNDDRIAALWSVIPGLGDMQ